MIDSKATVYSFEIDNLADPSGGLWHDINIRVTDTNYVKAYKRAMDLVPKVFPMGTLLRYTISIGDWDGSLPDNERYKPLSSKYFRNSLPPATLEAYNMVKDG